MDKATWASAKANLTKHAKSKSVGSRSDRAYRARAVRRFVGAQGGARAASAASPAGRRAARQLGAFLSYVSREGAQRTLERFDLAQFLGEDVQTFIAALTDKFVEEQGLDEEAVAKKAMARTLVELFDEAEVIDKLTSLTDEDMEDALRGYISAYVTERLVQAIGARIEKNALTPVKAVRLERDLSDFIRQEIRRLTMNISVSTFDWEGGKAAELVHQVFTRAYGILESVAS